MKDLSKEVVPPIENRKAYWEMYENFAEYLGVPLAEVTSFIGSMTYDFRDQTFKPGTPQIEVFQSLEGLFRD